MVRFLIFGACFNDIGVKKSHFFSNLRFFEKNWEFWDPKKFVKYKKHPFIPHIMSTKFEHYIP